mmetsp:Transcript_34125/g.62890  ORF Transcript_34125/g.62890 Transcript_34125/m.62890 type:complete len:340 (-) Transcript_34125:676-1695(-)
MKIPSITHTSFLHEATKYMMLHLRPRPINPPLRPLPQKLVMQRTPRALIPIHLTNLHPRIHRTIRGHPLLPVQLGHHTPWQRRPRIPIGTVRRIRTKDHVIVTLAEQYGILVRRARPTVRRGEPNGLEGGDHGLFPFLGVEVVVVGGRRDVPAGVRGIPLVDLVGHVHHGQIGGLVRRVGRHAVHLLLPSPVRERIQRTDVVQIDAAQHVLGDAPRAVIVLQGHAGDTPFGLFAIVQIGISLTGEYSPHRYPLVGTVGNGGPLFAVGTDSAVGSIAAGGNGLVAVYFVGTWDAIFVGGAKVYGVHEGDTFPASSSIIPNGIERRKSINNGIRWSRRKIL